MDNAARLANQARLRKLVRNHPREVHVFSAHCATAFQRHAASSLPVASALIQGADEPCRGAISATR